MRYANMHAADHQLPAQRRNTAFPMRASAALAFLALQLPLHAEEVDFRNIGTFDAPEYTEGALTVSADPGLGILEGSGGGLGVVGGDNDKRFDADESAFFEFALPRGAQSVIIDFNGSNRHFFEVAAQLNGAFLGVVEVNALDGSLDLTEAMGGQVITSFSVSSVEFQESSEDIDAIRFEPVPAPDYGWGEPFFIEPPADDVDVVEVEAAQAVFDSTGEAIVVAVGRREFPGTASLYEVRSLGREGAWTGAQTIYDSTAEVFSALAMVIDDQARITVLVGEDRGSNDILALHYVPGVGWQEPVPVFENFPINFGDPVTLVADAQGNLVAGLSQNLSSLEFVGAVYNANTGRWSLPFFISPPGETARNGAIVASRDGQQIQAVYTLTRPDRSLLLTRRFLAPSLGFAPAQPAPGIPDRIGDIAPPVIDEDGALTTLFYESRLFPQTDQAIWVLKAIRYEDEQWGLPSVVQVHRDEDGDFRNFSDTDVARNGDVFFIYTRFDRFTGVNLRTVLRYNAASDLWDSAFQLQISDRASSSRTRIAAREDGTALAGYRGEGAMVSRLFSNAVWDEPILIPQASSSFFRLLADGQDVLMIDQDDGGSGGDLIWFRDR
ncbi:MAG: hypothetical protein AAGA68_19535 [Pseudomonadota bacterium]